MSKRRRLESDDVVVIDNGSGTIRAGFAGDKTVTSVFHNIVGRSWYRRGDDTFFNRSNDYIGDAAQIKQGILTLKHPMVHGIVVDWSAMERVWQYLYQDLGGWAEEPEGCPVLITEAPLNPKHNREQMAEVLFEELNASSLYIANPALLALFSSGRTTGVVLDCGDGVTHVASAHEGYVLPQSIQRINLAGRNLTEYLMKSLNKRGINLTSTGDREIVRLIKEKLCFASLDTENEMPNDSSLERKYVLPDGQDITVANERFKTTENLFKPSLLGMSDTPGVHNLIHSSIMMCEEHQRKDLYRNIILSGGSTMCPGFGDRMKQELTRLAPSDAQVKVISPPERLKSSWLGGSILASLSSFQNMLITRAEYDEQGPSITHRKCL